MNDVATTLRENLMPDLSRRALIVPLGRSGGAPPAPSPDAIGIELPTAILLRADEVIE
jgi:hypothetical protein